jgi:hypothetical protein
MSNVAPDDPYSPLELEARFAISASQELSSRIQHLCHARGLKAAQSYVLGMLVAAVAGARVNFGDAMARRIMDAQMSLELPPPPAADSERRH